MWKAHGRARRTAVSGALVIGAVGTFGLGISQVAATIYGEHEHDRGKSALGI
jgi:hypothetical protein